MKTQRPSQIRGKLSAQASKLRAPVRNFPAPVRALPASAGGFLVAVEKSANTRRAFPASGQNFARNVRCLPVSPGVLPVTGRKFPVPLRRLPVTARKLANNAARFANTAPFLPVSA